jgi:hypothetical protein
MFFTSLSYFSISINKNIVGANIIKNYKLPDVSITSISCKRIFCILLAIKVQTEKELIYLKSSTILTETVFTIPVSTNLRACSMQFTMSE